MKPRIDPVLRNQSERLHYATGELLGANDFRDEQTYHRRQLARALLFLNGSGTIAGLRVVARHRPAADPENHEVHLEVRPGLALDRAGRLIEVPRAACLRLHRWFNFFGTPFPGPGKDPHENERAALLAAWNTAWAKSAGIIPVDVFVEFHECDRGFTPAFASGPFDALDASQPSRIRDAYRLSLVIRTEPNPPPAVDPWAGIRTAPDRVAAARQMSLEAWETLAVPPPNPVGGDTEGPPRLDSAAVLLARISIRTDGARQPDWSAATWPDPTPPAPAATEVTPNVDNTVRNFILPAAAIRALAGI